MLKCRSSPPMLPGGTKDQGYAVVGTTVESAAFLRRQLDEPGFFTEKPLYSFRKIPAP